MMKQLTKKQKQFVFEYIKLLDGEKALLKAGYKTANPSVYASSLLNKDSIVNEINKQLKLQIETHNVPKGYVIRKLLQIAEFSLTEEDVLDKDGNYTGKKKLRDSSAGLKALESLCKYLGFNNQTPQEENTYREAKIITISNLDDTKI